MTNSIATSRAGKAIIRTVATKKGLVGLEAQTSFIESKGCTIAKEDVKTSDNMETQTWAKKTVIRDVDGNITTFLKQIEIAFPSEIKEEIQNEYNAMESMIPEDIEGKEARFEFFIGTIMGLGSYKESEYFQFLEENM